MKPALAALALAALAWIASSGRLRQARSTLLAQLSASGFLFLALGLFAGPTAAALVPAKLETTLQPIESLALGVAGLALGLSLELPVLARLPGRVYGASFVQALAALAPVALAAFGALGASPSWPVVGASLAAAAALMLSSSHFALVLGQANEMSVRASRAVALLSSLEDVVGLGLYGAALVVATLGEPARGLRLLGESAGLGLFCAVLAIALLWDAGEELTFAVLLGLAALFSGACAHLRVSALVGGGVAGAVLAFATPVLARRIYRVLARVERPIYLIVLFLLGTRVDLTDLPAMLCALALVVLRGWGKVLGGRAARRLAPMLPLPLEPGFALLSPAPIAMCMLAELSHLLSLPFSQRLVDLGVLGALACEIASAAMVRKSAVEPLPVIEEAQP